jgi:hypothetical protein
MNWIILLSLLIFSILVSVLLKNINQNTIITETYLNTDNIGITNFLNDKIIQYSLYKTDTLYEEKIRKLLMNNKQNITDIIKYTDENNKYSDWIKTTEYNNINKLSEISAYMYYSIIEKLSIENIQILYYKLNKLKYNSIQILADYDIILFKTNDIYAYHINLLCVFNIRTNNIIILCIKMIGIVSEDNINQYTYLNENDNYKHIKMYKNNIISDVSTFDSFNSLKDQDQRVENVLYEKIIKDDDIKNDEDYKKNIKYTNDQNIIRKMFLNNLNNTCKINSKNIYKLYPYNNDFFIF